MPENTFQGTPNWYGGEQGVLKPFLERAESESRAPFKPYRPPQGLERYAPFSPLQTQSFQKAAAEASNPLYDRLYTDAARRIREGGDTSVLPTVNPYLQSATTPTNLDVSPYMNPYMDSVVNRVSELGNRNLRENVLPNIQSRFIGAGQYGSSGHQTLTERAIRDNQEAIAAEQGKLLQGGYNTALETALRTQGGEKERALQAAQLAGSAQGRDIDRRMSSGEALGNVANQQQLQALRSTATLNQLGGQQQAQDQQGRNFAWEEFQRELNYPYFRTARFHEALRGLPMNQQQFSSNYTPPAPGASPYTQGGGLLAGLYGASQSRSFAKGGHVKGIRHYAQGGGVPVSPIQAGVNDALDTAELQSMRTTAQRMAQPQVNPFWSAVARAGFNVAANRQPGVIAALGQGAQAGMDEYNQQLTQQGERELKSANIMNLIDNTRRLQAERNRQHQLNLDKFANEKKEFGMKFGMEGAKLQLLKDKLAHEKTLYEQGLKGNKPKSSIHQKANEKALEQIGKSSLSLSNLRERLAQLKDIASRVDSGPYKGMLPSNTYNMPVIGGALAAGKPEDVEAFDSLKSQLELDMAEMMKSANVAVGTRKTISETKPSLYKTREGNLAILNNMEHELDLLEEKNNFMSQVMDSGGNALDGTKAFNRYIKDKLAHEKKNPNTPYTKTPEDFISMETLTTGASPSGAGSLDELTDEQIDMLIEEKKNAS